MASVSERLTEQFYQWELRGRGWQVFDTPVSPEPPFRPFYGHFLGAEPQVDDGRRPTALSSFVQKLSDHFTGKRLIEEPAPEDDPEPEPGLLIRDSLIELQTSLPANLNIPRDVFEEFLLNLSLAREPIAFELLGLPTSITAQFAADQKDAPTVRQQLQAYFPDAVFIPKQDTLEAAWNEHDDAETAIVEFGLAREFMLLLATRKLDPFIGLTGALAELKPGELGLFQILFQPVHHPWAESILRSVTDNEGGSFFVNTPELVAAAKNKVSGPLYGVVVRLAARGADFERAWDIVRDIAGVLGVFAEPRGNELIPLKNDEYPFADHVEDVLHRQSRRSGMLLNSEELISFVHLPSAAVRSPKLRREMLKTKAAPKAALGKGGLLLGQNSHAGQVADVCLTPEERVRHTHVIGASGTGKSTLLFNLIRQDITNGEGVAVLDPHGDLVERILGIIPPERINDVVLVDPSDEEYSVGFNILSAHSDLEKNLLASDLVSVFQRLSTSWGDQMGSVLNNAILAFLESSQGGTLSDLRRFLIEPAFRNRFLETVRDPDIVYYWQKGFPQLSGNKSIGPVLTRLETFLSPKPIRYMVSQRVNRLDFAHILDTGKIFLAKLPQGTMGRENAYLLGTLLVAKFQQLAMSRQRMSEEKRRHFWLYIDEFHNFITPSMAEILTGARKYRIGLILAHQELRQLQRDSEVASAVISNPYTRICFRVGDQDARVLEGGFSYFEARDLQNLSTGEAICRLERTDFDFNLTMPMPEEPSAQEAAETRGRVITASREKYATARAEIEAVLFRRLDVSETERPPVSIGQAAKQPAASPPPAAETQAPLIPDTPAVSASRPATSEALPPTKPLSELSPARVSSPEPSSIPEPPLVRKEPPPIPIAEQKPSLPPPDMGRGGAQHQAIQQRLKAVAEGLGYRSTLEKPILDGQGSVDLALEKPNRAIACEISITTTIDHEFGNVAKCLKAGFAHVAVISSKQERLNQIATAVRAALPSEEAARVGYYLPDEFIAHLQALAMEDAKAPLPTATEERRRGYKIKRSFVQLTTEEAKAREEAAVKMLAETMRKKI